DMPKISGTYGQTVADMTLTDGVAKVGSEEITGTWKLTDSNETNVPVVGTTDTYQVTFTPTDSQYESVIVQVTPTVKQKPITVTAENKTKTYGENNPDLTFTVPDGALVGTDTEDALGVTLSCEATAVSPVKEGGYAITGTSSSANYNVTVTPGTLTIEKADATITVGTDTYSKTFGDAAFNLSDVTDTNTEANVQYEVTAGDAVSVSNGTVTILKAGTAEITVSLPASTNYNAADTKTITVTVAKKSGYTVADINKSYLYSRNNADTIDLSKYLPANCGTVTYGTPQVNGALYTDDGQPAVSDDGKLSYTVKQAEIYGAAGTIQVTVTTDNYADFTITVNVKLIDQIPVSLKEGSSVTLQNSTLTYGQALSTLTFNSAVFVDDDGNEVAGTLAWKTPDEKPNAGTTSATWVFTPNDASYATVEDTVAITVNKATPQVTNLPTVADRTYNPTVSLTNSDLTGGTVSVAGSWSWQTANIIPTVNNSGYVAVFTPENTTNYNTVTKTITVTVSKATPYIETAPTAAAITYGDTLGASTLSGGTVQYSSSDATTVAGSFAWKDSSVKPSVSDSDSTTYRIVFTPSDADNYNTVETDITLIVNKAENAPNMPSSTMNVANSCEKVSDVTLPTGWVWQDADKDTALTVGTAVTATAEYNGADKGNYENETVSVTITRSACEHAHTEIRDAKTATCTAGGYTGDTYCTDCG
ncbi:MAG: MBG domain-containing protein, partial [Lachnospiraceae bacterium]